MKIMFDNSNQGCCWLRPLVSPRTLGGASGWKMLAHVDMTPHPITGQINSSPVTAPIPFEKFYRGCDYNLRIAGTWVKSDGGGHDVIDNFEFHCNSMENLISI